MDKLVLWGEAPFVFMGPSTKLPGASLACGDGSRIEIEGELSGSQGARLNARNGGSIYVGLGGLWADNVTIFTDDMHAIRDVATGARLNQRGTTVTIGRHVWIGSGVLLLPGSSIGDGSVVGARAIVTKPMPSQVVCAGVPARVIRTGAFWTHSDDP